MNDPRTPEMNGLAIYRRFLPYLRPYWTPGLLTLLLLAGQTVMDVLAPWPIKFVFDSVIGHHSVTGWLGHIVHALTGGNRLSLLTLIAVAFISIALLDGLFSYGGSLLLSNMGQRFVFAVRRDLFAHVQGLSLRFHATRRTGDLLARLTADINNIQDMVVTALSTVVGNSLTILLMFLVMLRLDWRYTLIAVVVVPFMYLTARYYRRAIKQATRQARRSEGRVSSIVQEVISSIRVVQAYTREDYEQARFEQQSNVSLHAGLRSATLQAQFAPIINFLGSIGTVVVLWFGVREVLAGRLTAGELLVFVSYFRALYSPLRQLAKVSTITARGTASAERVLEMLGAPSDVQDLPTARPAPKLRGQVTFRGVSFGYETNQDVLHDLSYTAEPGSVTALVGPTGSGKTTLMSLIPRFYEPSSGSVCIDGQDTRHFTLRSLRSQISLVLQEAVLFHGTIAENIRYGKPDATAAEIQRAMEMANAAEFVARLPDGIDTIVGERGTTLSGGERQRIAIARALVRDAPILILDEPTVGLDAETEHLVLSALQRLMVGRTTFVIAHHLGTIQSADMILVLERGRIVESGRHAQLLKANGPYARLYQRQIVSLDRTEYLAAAARE